MSSEEETIAKVRAREGLLGKIQNIITGGYGTKEDLRELDKKLRDGYYSTFSTLRHRWEEIYLAALNSGKSTMADRFKKVIQMLDRISEKVNRADYGYAGLMDRKGHIRENELARIFNYDKALDQDVNNIHKIITELHRSSEAEIWDGVEAKVKSVKSLLLDFESKWSEREKEFRPLER